MSLFGIFDVGLFVTLVISILVADFLNTFIVNELKDLKK